MKTNGAKLKQKKQKQKKKSGEDKGNISEPGQAKGFLPEGPDSREAGEIKIVIIVDLKEQLATNLAESFALMRSKGSFPVISPTAAITKLVETEFIDG